MYEIKLTWENGNKEEKTFNDYSDMLSYLASNPDAGFMAWLNGEQMNEADICRDVELVRALQSWAVRAKTPSGLGRFS